MGSALLDLASAAYPAMAEFYASDWAALEARNEGLYVCSGCAISASGTAGKVDLSAGTIFSTTTELNVTAVTAATTTITSIADATNPKWVGLEIDSSGVLQFNQGTAAASPLKPALTAARVLVAWLYVPAAATAVDALLSTANGKAKIMDARQLMTVHPARQVATDGAGTTLTNSTALASVLASAPVLPAASLSTGDVILIEGVIRYLNSQNASTIEIKLTFGAVTIFDWTTVSLTSSASARHIPFRAQVYVASTAVIDDGGRISVGVAGAVGGADADSFDFGNASAITVANAQTIDLQCKVTTSSSTSVFALRSFMVSKFPV